MEWNIGKIATKRAILTPDKPAIIFEDQPYTYKQMNDGSNRVAAFLKEKGIKKGDRISVLLLNCPEFFEVYFAAAKLGVIFIPLNFRLVGPELEYQINNCGSRLLLFHDSLIKNFDSIRSKVVVENDKYIYLKSGLSDCPDCPDWAVEYHQTMDSYCADEIIPDEEVEFDDPLAIIFTSGVTGDPKGALLSHQQTYFKNFQIMEYMDMREDDIYLCQLPSFHSGGLFVAATPSFCRGATLLLRKSFNPEIFTRDIEKYKVTIMLVLTTMWRLILKTGELDNISTKSVRVAMGGGERTPLSLLDDLAKRGIFLRLGFGQTENSAMMMVPKEAVTLKKGSIGVPGFYTQVWIADNDGKELPPNEIGEIVAKGPTVMSGYWNMPEKTAEAIVNGILFTGDLGYRDEDGFFYIVDRSKDMYRSGGENVYPAEVEKVLAGHPKIDNVSIIGVADDKWGESGKAIIVLNDDETLTQEEVNQYLKGKVARYKFPGSLEFIKELPLTGSGKIKKAFLKQHFGGVKLS